MGDPQIKLLARRIAHLEKQMLAQKQANLGYSTIDGGAVQAADDDGNQTMVIGQQFDGTNAPAVLISPEPPAPYRPLVTPVPGGLIIEWGGTYAADDDSEDITIVSPMDWARVDVVISTDAFPDFIATPPSSSFTSPRGGEIFVALPAVAHKVALVTRTISGRASRVAGYTTETPETIEGVSVQTISTSPPPLDLTDLSEGHAWWQVQPALDEEGDPTGFDKVVGFWRLDSGAWVPQQVITMEALHANNVLVKALDGEEITGATVQTRSEDNRGIKMIAAEDEDGNPLDAFYVFDESGFPFISAIPSTGMAVVAGKLTAASLTVSPLQPDDKATMAGLTEIVRYPDGTAGELRLTAYTTRPASPPILLTGYDTVQFPNDGQWDNRFGWATDGTDWYTLRSVSKVSGPGELERWDAGTGDSEVFGYTGGFDVNDGDIAGGVTIGGGYVYTLAYSSFQNIWWLTRRLISAGPGPWESQAKWTGDDGLDAPALGYDAASGDLLIAQSRPSNANKVRVRRYTWPATSGDPLVAGASVDADWALDSDLAGVAYGAYDFGGASHYTLTTRGTGHFRHMGTTGAQLTDYNWQSGMSGKVGYAYASGAFVSMDTNGLMRTYTGQDKAFPIGHADLNKWVSNTLANATYETDQSPRSSILIPKRSKLSVTTSAINTGGANAPDRVKIYVGKGAADPGRDFMIRQTDPAVGEIHQSYPSIATSPDTNPPATNGFIAAGGTVQKFTQADGTVIMDGLGKGSPLASYTPVWASATTQPVVGNGSLVGRYARLPRNMVKGNIVLTAGSTTTLGTGSPYTFSLPIPARNLNEVLVFARMTGPIKTYIGSGQDVNSVVLTNCLTELNINPTNAGIVNGTVLRIDFFYEAA